jgi:flavin reductase (DIM6/NTAB) family NADH-FMN oxidoreductase RutF
MQTDNRFRSEGAKPANIFARNSTLHMAGPLPVDRLGFLQAMGNVAHSVSVVTTDGRGGRFGQTVTSFCSVSADPPQILCCIRSASPLKSAIEMNGCFAINVLGERQFRTADAFAGRSTEFPAYSFEHVAHGKDHNGCPIFDSASSQFSCLLSSSIEGGSHAIFVGNVTEAKLGEEAPLLYRSRDYGTHVLMKRSQ